MLGKLQPGGEEEEEEETKNPLLQHGWLGGNPFRWDSGALRAKGHHFTFPCGLYVTFRAPKSGVFLQE